MSSILRRLTEAFKRKPKAATATPQAPSLVEWPEIPLKDAVRLYTNDPTCKSCVDMLASQAVGMGFYTTFNPEYYRAEKAKDLVDGFCERIGLDQLLLDGARMLIACGNEFWLKITPKKLMDIRRLPVEAIQRIELQPISEEVKVPYTVAGYALSYAYGASKLNPESVIHFRINAPAGSAWGIGVLQVLLSRLTLYGETRPSIAEVKAKIESIMPRIFEKYAGPDVLAILPDATEEDVQAFQRVIKSRPAEGAWLFWQGKTGDVKPIQMDPRARFEYYIDHILNQFILGLETPLPRLFTSPGFTEASANVAKELGDAIIRPIQRYIKRIVEREIFMPLLEQAGLDPAKAQIRLNWGAPKLPDINMADMLKAAELGLIRSEEFRKNAVKMGWELWDKPAPETGQSSSSTYTEVKKRE